MIVLRWKIWWFFCGWFEVFCWWGLFGLSSGWVWIFGRFVVVVVFVLLVGIGCWEIIGWGKMVRWLVGLLGCRNLGCSVGVVVFWVVVVGSWWWILLWRFIWFVVVVFGLCVKVWVCFWVLLWVLMLWLGWLWFCCRCGWWGCLGWKLGCLVSGVMVGGGWGVGGLVVVRLWWWR